MIPKFIDVQIHLERAPGDVLACYSAQSTHLIPKQIRRGSLLATIVAEALSTRTDASGNKGGNEASISLGACCQESLVEMKAFRGTQHRMIGSGTLCGRAQCLSVRSASTDPASWTRAGAAEKLHYQ